MAQRSDDATSAQQVGTAGPVSDELAMLSAVGSGDQAAFRRLSERHLGAIVAVARRILNDEAEAEDVAQETMLRLWTQAATLQVPPAGIRPWLRRVATNLSLDRLRSRRRTDVTDEVPEQPQEPEQGRDLEQREISARVAAALAALPERQRLALVLFHFEGRSQVDVGAALGVSDEAVESLLSRARRALRAALKDDWRDLLPDATT